MRVWKLKRRRKQRSTRSKYVIVFVCYSGVIIAYYKEAFNKHYTYWLYAENIHIDIVHMCVYVHTLRNKAHIAQKRSPARGYYVAGFAGLVSEPPYR